MKTRTAAAKRAKHASARRTKRASQTKISQGGAIAVIVVIVGIIAFALLGGIKGSPAGVDLNNTQNQSGPQGAGANILITIQNKEYSTTLVAIHAGDSVTWKNLEDTRHFVLLSSITNSGALQKGQSWTYVFNQSGTYTFRDMDWPLMKGNITVS